MGVRGVSGGEPEPERVAGRRMGGRSRRSQSRRGGVKGGSAVLPTADPAGEIKGVGEYPPPEQGKPSPPPCREWVWSAEWNWALRRLRRRRQRKTRPTRVRRASTEQTARAILAPGERSLEEVVVDPELWDSAALEEGVGWAVE